VEKRNWKNTKQRKGQINEKEVNKMKNRNLPAGDDWKTPDSLYDELNKEFHFTFDPCPLNNAINICGCLFFKYFNGLEVKWEASNFINPPYNRIAKEAFIRKAYNESLNGKLCVMLLPVSTSTKIFHEIILPHAEIRFLKGRVKFEGVNTKGEFVNNKCGMHDSMICIFRGKIKND